MLRNLFYRKPKSIGIDIGDTAIAIVALRRRSNKIIVSHMASRDFSSNADIEQQKIKFLQNFFARNKINNENIYVAIPSLQVIKKELLFDEFLQDLDIKLQLEMEQKQYFAGINEKLIFDFIRSGRNAMIYAIKQQTLTKKLEFLQAIGIHPICIEPDSFAWLRLINVRKKKILSENELNILLILQKYTAKIILFNDNEILYENDKINREKGIDINFVQHSLEHFRATNSIYKFTTMYVIGEADWIGQCGQDIVKFELPKKINHKLLLAFGLALRGIDDCN